MTSHLPECVCYDKVHAHKCALCICDRLRACEHRVEETWSAIAGRDQYAEGYRAALNAAREAVESVWTIDPSWDGTNWNNALHEAIVAIDALREKP